MVGVSVRVMVGEMFTVEARVVIRVTFGVSVGASIMNRVGVKVMVKFGLGLG